MGKITKKPTNKIGKFKRQEPSDDEVCQRIEVIIQLMKSKNLLSTHRELFLRNLDHSDKDYLLGRLEEECLKEIQEEEESVGASREVKVEVEDEKVEEGDYEMSEQFASTQDFDLFKYGRAGSVPDSYDSLDNDPSNPLQFAFNNLYDARNQRALPPSVIEENLQKRSTNKTSLDFTYFLTQAEQNEGLDIEKRNLYLCLASMVTKLNAQPTVVGQARLVERPMLVKKYSFNQARANSVNTVIKFHDGLEFDLMKAPQMLIAGLVDKELIEITKLLMSNALRRTRLMNVSFLCYTCSLDTTTNLYVPFPPGFCDAISETILRGCNAPQDDEINRQIVYAKIQQQCLSFIQNERRNYRKNHSEAEFRAMLQQVRDAHQY